MVIRLIPAGVRILTLASITNINYIIDVRISSGGVWWWWCVVVVVCVVVVMVVGVSSGGGGDGTSSRGE
jgi:uncharacterized membrane-anchored protein